MQPAPGTASRRRLHQADGLAVLVTAGFAVVTTAIFDDGLRAPAPWVLLLVACAVLPLVVRDRWPWAVLAVVVLAESIRFALLDPLGEVTAFVVPVASLVAAYNLALRLPLRRTWPHAVVATAVLLLGLVVGTDGRHQLIDSLLTYHGMAAATALGAVVRVRGRRMAQMRSRAERAEATRAEEARRQVVAERVRIARDLHDVLAHHITLVNAQAGVAEYLVDTDPVAARRALRDITTHTRGALDELRATVGLLRSDDESPDDDGSRQPVPGMHRFSELLDGFRGAGSTVSARVVGPSVVLTSVADLAAYRIVQEALTNANKHAPGAPVSVTLTWSAQVLDILVINGPGPRPAPDGTGTGHGLIGMQERAHAAGGTLRIERPRAGGFLVAATLPTAAADDAGAGMLSR